MTARLPFEFLTALCLFAALGLVFLPGSAIAQYPERKVNLVLGWGAGGVTDISARAFAPLLARHLGASVTVQNKPGGAGAIGTTFVEQQPADGYTLLFSAETPASFRVLGTNDLSFYDFIPVTMISGSEKVIVVAADSPYQTMQDLADDIKARPGKVRSSYTGPGASGHIQGLLMREQGGLDFSMTPFGSGKDCLLAVLSGQVDFTSPNVGTVIDYIRAGKVRVLANFDKKPSRYVPQAPPISESIPGLEPYLPLDYPNCLLIKKGTPPEIVEKISAAATAVLNDPDWHAFVEKNWYTSFGDIKGQDVIKFWDRWASIVCWILYDSGVAKNNPAQFNIPRLGAGE
ncbi:tripartite tricarboxylate transporter substrate binding protein [Desulfovibrio sp. OttesenSCG-928-C06]|nr:tripartite tricarboxylate transporter substrate binding protein [Desulfovibrio sp. OttesenSCG-928-C06]